MKVMFDSGSTKSFINKAALKRIKHLPINYNYQNYLMADGYTTFEVHGYVKIFIQFNQMKTNIIVGVVKSLLTDCILGMDYINKYKVNLNNKEKQIQIHTSDDKTIIPMKDKNFNLKIICQLINSTYIYPYREKRIKIVTQVPSGKMLFSPAYHLTYKKGLVTPHSLISIVNHVAWITIYNSTAQTCYLKENIIVGVVSPQSSINYISTIVNLTTKHKLNGNQDRFVTPTYAQTTMFGIQHATNYQKSGPTHAQAKAPFQQLSSNESEPSSEETTFSDDQPLQEEGHEFNVQLIAEAQNTDKLYQEKVLERKKNVTNCSYVVHHGILYKLFQHGVFTRKLIYVPPSILNQLLDVYHNAPSTSHFGFYRVYYMLKDKYWWPDMKRTIKNYIKSCLKCQNFNVDCRRHATTKSSSYQLQFGCQLKFPFVKPKTTYQYSQLNNYFCPFYTRSHNYYQKIRNNITKNQQSYEHYYDGNHANIYYKLDDTQHQIYSIQDPNNQQF